MFLLYCVWQSMPNVLDKLVAPSRVERESHALQACAVYHSSYIEPFETVESRAGFSPANADFAGQCLKYLGDRDKLLL